MAEARKGGFVELMTAVAAGLLIGVVVGALGAGGGILSVPVLTHVLGQSAHDAAAGSLVIVTLTALAALWPAMRDHRVCWRDGLLFGALSTLGSVIATRISVRLDGVLLMVLFSAMLLVIGLLMLWRGCVTARMPRQEHEEQRRRGAGVIVLAASACGLLTGFFGVGGGFIVVPMLVLALGFRIKEASGTSLVVMIMAAAAGLTARVGTPVSIDWPVVLVFAVASMCGGLVGGPITRRVSSSTLTTAFGVLLLAVSVASLLPVLGQLSAR
ncbi:Sulfite exporter TauE/SafE [Actinomyces bovis]|uniref:Probable membrane transporter protein n=1 Tax=Actinomyces bovis TaxID=1658 RepID=A0ABY1VKG2_9ACTO|nr:sulfite exporter TauE/SafE family protein [Actinomyces bovis]SPT52591.1 Sulfite exporter TauE/SafE [Actinomyces bovis]VEG54393.1 Sulfite exporter TauE/SafE [Actinomyces israelii]